MIIYGLREVELSEGENPEYLLDVRKRPFDYDCNEIVPLDSYQLATFEDICGYWTLWRKWKASGLPAIAYNQLRAEFLKLTNCSEEHLSEYTVDQVAYCIRHTLSESSIPMFLLNGRNKMNVWRQRYEILMQSHILEYWHKQEIAFLTRKRQYDNTQSPDEKDDPWRYFSRYKTLAFIPKHDLAAAYLVLGASLDACAVMWIFSPQEIRNVYPEFFHRYVQQANGQKYEPRIRLTARSEAEFFETLWIQIKLDLQSHGFLDTDSSNRELTSHGPDFRSVSWYGTEYSFTGNQAACVKILWEAWEKGLSDVGKDYILCEIESDASRLRDVFKQGRELHPAWNTMIMPGKSQGSYRLSSPKNNHNS